MLAFIKYKAKTLKERDKMSLIQINEEQIIKSINRGRSTDKLLIKLEDSQEYVFKYNREQKDNK